MTHTRQKLESIDGPGYPYRYMGKQFGHRHQPCRRLRSIGWLECKIEVEFEDGVKAIVPRQLLKRRPSCP